jgi:hypothetical protein
MVTIEGPWMTIEASMVTIERPCVTLEGPMVTIEHPWVIIEASMVTIGRPWVTIGRPKDLHGPSPATKNQRLTGIDRPFVDFWREVGPVFPLPM